MTGWSQDRFEPFVAGEDAHYRARMKAYRPLLLIALALATGPALANSPECRMPTITGARELNQFLSLRAVEVIKLASGHDARLATLVAPSATFGLGAGDVGRTVGTGADGAQELARTMHADSYRFMGWDYMDTPAAPCSTQKVEVEFIDSRGKQLSRVEFTFEDGLVVSATGWERSFEEGRL